MLWHEPRERLACRSCSWKRNAEKFAYRKNKTRADKRINPADRFSPCIKQQPKTLHSGSGENKDGSKKVCAAWEGDVSSPRRPPRRLDVRNWDLGRAN